jgi:hypothetical protein
MKEYRTPLLFDTRKFLGGYSQMSITQRFKKIREVKSRHVFSECNLSAPWTH